MMPRFILQAVRDREVRGASRDEAIRAVLTSEDRCECDDPIHGPAPCLTAIPTGFRVGDRHICGTCYTRAHLMRAEEGR